MPLIKELVRDILFGFFLNIFPEHRSKFEQERKEPEPYTPLSGPLGKPQQQPPQLPLLPLPHPRSPFPPSGSPSIPSAVTAHLPDSTTESWTAYYSNHGEGKSSTLKHRCRDYDGKYFKSFSTFKPLSLSRASRVYNKLLNI